MGRNARTQEAEIYIGVITWQGSDADDEPPVVEQAEVIRLAPYLLAKRGRA